MAFPTTGILDDFNRANENPLSGGGDWGDRITNNDLQLLSNRAAGTGANVLNSRFWAADTFGPASEVYCTVPVINVSPDYLRLWLRLNGAGSAAENGYMMQWTNDANGCRIFREASLESYTQIAQNAAARMVAADQIGIGAIGSDITVYQNGSVVVTVSDATFSGAGQLALGCRSTVFRMADFGGGTIVPEGGEAFWVTTL